MSGMMMAAAAAGGVSGLDPDAAAFIARFTVPPNEARSNTINTLFLSLKSVGVFSKLDTLYIGKKAQDEQSAKLDLVRTTKTISYSGAVTWNPADGFKHAYNTGTIFDYAPANDGVDYSAYSAGLGVYFRNALTGSPDFGVSGLGLNGSGPSLSTDRVFLQVTVGDASSNVNGDYSSADQASWTDSNTGGSEVFYQLNRTASNKQTLYKSASALAAISGDTYNGTTRTLTTTSFNTVAPRTPILYAFWAGAPLTTTEQSDLKTALDTYFSAL